MRIDNLSSEKSGDTCRVSARFVWEESDRTPRDIFFETTGEFAEDLTCDPHAFLLVGLLRGMHYGERRICIDAEICPVLKSGLNTAMAILRSWYGTPGDPLVSIEARVRDGARPSTAGRAASMLSGGIDSLSVLRANRMNYPRRHPWSITDGLVIYGFDLGHQFKNYDQNYEANYHRQRGIFARRTSSLAQVADDIGLKLIPVHTNTQALSEDLDALSRKFHSADLAAVAHAFSRRLSVASIGATTTVATLSPWGSHPLLDPNYGSADLRIVHADSTLSRLDKTRLVAGWDAALQNLRVCTGWKEDPNAEALNCGRCEKCLRTMTALLVLGRLQDTRAFEANDLSEEMLRDGAQIHGNTAVVDWQELIEPLRTAGRPDLVRGVQAALRRYRHRGDPQPVKQLRGVAGRVKRKLLSSSHAPIAG